MTKEWRTIDGLQVDKDWLTADNQRLIQENDRLRAELLKAPDAGMIAFIAAFELWLGADNNGEDCELDEYIDSIGGEWSTHNAMDNLHVDIVDKFNAFKAQHIDSAEQETE